MISFAQDKMSLERKAAEVGKKVFSRLADTLGRWEFVADGLTDKDRAMVTVGGVDVTEIDFTTMQSKLYKNLYLAGEILDLDGPTGGYNLQICWTTGYVAGMII